MSYLLLPDDEVPFVQFLRQELGALMLRDELTTGGRAHIHADPTEAIGSTLPAESDQRTLVFWLRDVGPVATMQDAQEPTDARRRVAIQLTRESAGSRFGRLLDLARTPVLRWRRSSFRSSRLIIPGSLQAMDVPVSKTPLEVRRRHRAADSWLRRKAVPIDPFEHCKNLPIPAPANRRVFRVWAQPGAASWVAHGGEVWPWTA